MKQTAFRVGGVLLGLYLAWAIALGYYSTHRVIWDAESHSFLDVAVVPTLNDPSLSALRALGGPHWQKALDQNGGPLVRTLVGLGPLRALRVHGGSGLAWFHSFAVTAHYHVHAWFRNGTAVFRIALEKHGLSWRVTRLAIARKTGRS
ncbi:MAG TPA: hypothetical protein VMV40_03215 [Acidiferrobacter sp.]|nr:hypothetical protein [Acidiferrobacter sp.]